MENIKSTNDVATKDEQYKKSIRHCALDLLHDRIMFRREEPENTKAVLKHALKIIDNYITLLEFS